MQTFQQDCVELAQDLHARGRLPRRGLIQALTALGVLGTGPAHAQAGKPLVMVNWGGLANQGFGNFYGAPFVAETPGVTVVQDSTGPSTGRIRSMVESGRTTWDLCDSSASSSIVLGRANLATKIDYSASWRPRLDRRPSRSARCHAKKARFFADCSPQRARHPAPRTLG